MKANQPVMTIAVLLMVCGLNAQEIQCKCRQIEGEEYFCKCTAVTGSLPSSMVLTSTAPASILNSKPGPITSPEAQGAKQLATSSETAAPKGTPTGETTATGKTIYEGPRGGHYHYSASGKKVYEKHRK